MTAEIICVGTEILLGNIVNTNAAYLSERLASLGISVFFETTVGDNEERLEDVIRQGLERSDILILSGGLGPTKDDLTKEVATKACGQKLVEDEEALRRLKEYFASSHRSMTENNLKQALIPEDCDVLYNENETAPGMIIHAKGEKKVVLLPGPPSELIPMFHDQVEPILKELSSEVLYSDIVKIDCMGESKVAEEIEDLIEKRNIKGFKRLWLLQFIGFHLAYFVLGFVCIYVGTDAVSAFVNAIPDWVQKSMTVASTMLPALGMALLLKSLWNKEICPYYFLGFGLGAFFFYNNVTGASLVDGAVKLTSASTKILSLVQISFIGGCVAAIIIFNELRKIKDDEKRQVMTTTLDESEDFFND